jgi:cellulose synthase (UDP-forming)
MGIDTKEHVKQFIQKTERDLKPAVALAAKLFEFPLLLALLVLLFYYASLHVGKETQVFCSLAVIAVLFIASRFLSKKGLPRIIYLAFASFLVLRYIYWRFFFTLTYNDFFSFVCAWLLFLAEVYGVFMFLLSVFVNLRPIERAPAKTSADMSDCLSVDVFIPSYDEAEDLIATTLIGARSMHYPKDKLNVYLLDDGGTVTKRNQIDPAKAQQAQTRHDALQNLCGNLGVHYLTREKNVHAKAGNLNAALPRTHGDLILILDADHVPTVDFLQKTAGYFLEDDKLFLVQTPHFFINPDPIEKNLGLFQNMPSENLMFYGAIHPGLDFWNASFFCGSAALLRRSALLETNGFSGESITEDAETALMLHNRGWNSRYLKYPVISGLQPETFSSFMVQRMRWAQGMVQIFLLKNPLLMKGLSIPQKLSYLSSMTFWFFPISRIIFAFAPAAFLLFGLHIYNATLLDLAIYTIPYLIVLLMSSDYLFGKVRWNFISHIYELMQSMYSFRAVLTVLRNPRSPSFGVTPKSEKRGADFISPLAKPFYWMIIGTALVFLVGIWRFVAFADERTMTGAALFWAIFNFILFAACLGALLERRQRRANPRLPADFHATVKVDDDMIRSVYVRDISVGGASLVSSKDLGEILLTGNDLFLVGHNPLVDRMYSLPIEVRTHFRVGNKHVYGVNFKRENLDQHRDIVLLVHGDSRRWQKWMASSAPDPGFIRGMTFLTRSGLAHIIKFLMIFTATTAVRILPKINAHPRIHNIIKKVSLQS